MSKISQVLWFDGHAEAAATLYTSLIPNSRIDRVVRTRRDTPGGPADSVMVVEFTLDGQRYGALNGGAHYTLTPAFSIMMRCVDQTEVDRLWTALLEGGGKPMRCGWLTDRFGVSWQIVPEALLALMKDPDKAKAGRVMSAMMQMVKIDIAGLEAAAAATA